jgi:dihydroorotate dehydrogenase (fumarate)
MELTTTYLGLKLRNPIVAASSPLSRHISTLRRLEDAGAGAVVLQSLFEEDIMRKSGIVDPFLLHDEASAEEARSYYPKPPTYQDTSPEYYLRHVRTAKDALNIPVIASLNGVSPGSWVEYARDIEAAGADALELNVYFLPTDPNRSGAEIEETVVSVLREVKATLKIPVAVKLSPMFSAIPNIAKQLADNGADGLVLFNRFYQPDIDLEKKTVVPHLTLSSSEELLLPLRWTAILYGRVDTDLALTTGVHNTADALKGLAAGATVVMMASELLKNGVQRISEILGEMGLWLVENGYESLDDFRGSLSQQKYAAPAAFERANYIRVVTSYGPGYI